MLVNLHFAFSLGVYPGKSQERINTANSILSHFYSYFLYVHICAHTQISTQMGSFNKNCAYVCCCPFSLYLLFPPFFSQPRTSVYNLVYILQYFLPFSCKPYTQVCTHTHPHMQIHFTLCLNPTVCFRLRLEKVTLLNLFSGLLFRSHLMKVLSGLGLSPLL